MTKIISRAPFRLGLAGGGTDVLPYCYDLEGAVLNVTINKHCSVVIERAEKTTFSSLDLGITEELSDSNDVKLILHRGVHKYFQNHFSLTDNLNISTFSEAPAGSGLGSSSTIVVALVSAYAKYLEAQLTKYELAAISIVIERDELKLSGGLQDQYAAAFGGMNMLQFTSTGTCIVNRVAISTNFQSLLESCVLLISSGSSRNSAKIIEDQKKLALTESKIFRERLVALKAAAYNMQMAILKHDFDAFVEIMKQTWEVKKESSELVTNTLLEKIEADVYSSGADAFKVSGAGGGGYCQVYCQPQKRLEVSHKLLKLGYKPESVYFSNLGVQAWKTS